MAGARAVMLGCFRDVPQAIEAEWNRWYERSHIPARLALPGFIAARRFRAYEGECEYLTLYELESPEAVASELYLRSRRQEASLPATRFEARTREFQLFPRGVYQQVYPDAAYEMPDTDYLFVVAHDIPSNKEAEFTAWYDTEHIPAMLRVPGFATARRFKLAQLSPEAARQSSSPQFVTIYDLADRDAVECEEFLRDRKSPWSAWVRSWYTRRLRIKARQIYRLCQLPHG